VKSRQTIGEFMRFTTAGAYVQAVSMAQRSDRLAGGNRKSNKHRTAVWENLGRPSQDRRSPRRWAWRLKLQIVKSRAIPASALVVIVLLPLAWMDV
jgi:hypothetical protein